MAYNISVIGNKESILPFRAAGVRVYECNGRGSALKALKSAAGDSAVIYVTEDVFVMIRDEIAEYDDKPLPAVIPFPGTSGGTGLGMELLNGSVERAIGSNILQE